MEFKEFTKSVSYEILGCGEIILWYKDNLSNVGITMKCTEETRFEDEVQRLYEKVLEHKKEN